MSWTPPGVTSSLPGLTGSSQGLSGEFSLSLCPERSCSSSDVLDSFFGCSPVSLVLVNTPDMSVSPLVRSTLQLEAALLSPLSSMLGDLLHCCAGLSGGSGGVWDASGVCSLSPGVH